MKGPFRAWHCTFFVECSFEFQAAADRGLRILVGLTFMENADSGFKDFGTAGCAGLL